MNYWNGSMNWPLDEDWKCEICGKNYGLTWGLIHALCRCNECHAEYFMRSDDEKNERVTTPILLIKSTFIQAAMKFHRKTGKPVDDATREEWITLGVPEDEFKEKKDD